MKVGVIQINAGPDKAANMDQVLAQLQHGAAQGCDWIALPEMFNQRTLSLQDREPETVPGPSTQLLLTQAKTSQMWILAGSLFEAIPGDQHAYNTSVLISPKGEIAATYRKIHLFDVQVNQTQIIESSTIKAGADPTLVEMVPGIVVGLSVCYDLRFPELYRHYSKLGATVLTVPSSFTTPTGEKCWHTLNRARAIENQCFVIAPNQIGIGAGNVPTYGHSLIVGPDGQVLAEANEKDAQLITAELDFEAQAALRAQFPVLTHRRVSG